MLWPTSDAVEDLAGVKREGGGPMLAGLWMQERWEQPDAAPREREHRREPHRCLQPPFTLEQVRHERDGRYLDGQCEGGGEAEEGEGGVVVGARAEKW